MPYLYVNDFYNRYLRDEPAYKQQLALSAYIKMITEGSSLSSIYKGSLYRTARETLLRHRLITYTNDYVRRDGIFPRYRYLPVGLFIVADVYNKKPYKSKGNEYTVQLRIRLWTPLTFFYDINSVNIRLLVALYVPIANYLFSRINVRADLYKMSDEFTVGIQDSYLSPFHDLDKWTVFITKTNRKGRFMYVYDAPIIYQWYINNNNNSLYTDLCNITLLNLLSCTTGKSIEEEFQKNFEKFDIRLYSEIRRKCEFTLPIIRLKEIPICCIKTKVNVDAINKLLQEIQ